MPQKRQHGKSSPVSSSNSGSPPNKQQTSPGRQHESEHITRSVPDQSYHSDTAKAPLQSVSDIRGTWTGKIFIITGLSNNHFPIASNDPSLENQRDRKERAANGRYLTTNDESPSKGSQTSYHSIGLGPSPHKRRPGLKRKRSAMNNADTASEIDADEDADEDGLPRMENGLDTDHLQGSKPVKRRRRGRQSQVQSQVPSRAPSPQLPMLDAETDILADIDLPDAFLTTLDVDHPDEPDDEAQLLYKELYEPLTGAMPFVTALTKFDPRQRSIENLYKLAANTAAALRIWQDEYLRIDRLTARYAPIARKPATGNRQAIDPTTFEDQKEADLYDYNYDAKKPGYQDPVAQRASRFGFGRELRHRSQRGRIGADGQVVNAAAANASDDDGSRRQRARKPVHKYDGIVPADQQRRKRGLGSAENDQPAKRGRTSGRGSRGGRGSGRGGRGASLLGKRIQEMREASVGMSIASGSGDDGDSGSEAGGGASAYNSREASLALPPDRPMETEPEQSPAPTFAEALKRKGRPKGSKNLHVRSDKGIPKGPRNKSSDPSRTLTPHTESPPINRLAQTQLETNLLALPELQVNAGPTSPSPAPTSSTFQSQAQAGKEPRSSSKSAQPKSEKRSQSMTDWWARRKAAAAQAKALDPQTSSQTQANAPPRRETPAHSPKTTLTTAAYSTQPAYPTPSMIAAQPPQMHYAHSMPPGMVPMQQTHYQPYPAPHTSNQQGNQPPPHHYQPYSQAPPQYIPQGYAAAPPPPGWQHMPIPMPSYQPHPHPPSHAPPGSSAPPPQPAPGPAAPPHSNAPPRTTAPTTSQAPLAAPFQGYATQQQQSDMERWMAERESWMKEQGEREGERARRTAEERRRMGW